MCSRGGASARRGGEDADGLHSHANVACARLGPACDLAFPVKGIITAVRVMATTALHRMGRRRSESSPLLHLLHPTSPLPAYALPDNAYLTYATPPRRTRSWCSDEDRARVPALLGVMQPEHTAAFVLPTSNAVLNRHSKSFCSLLGVLFSDVIWQMAYLLRRTP